MKNSTFILNQAGSGDGCSLGGLILLRLEKLIYVHVPVCSCYRQMFPASSVCYAFSSPCVAIWGLRRLMTKREVGVGERLPSFR